MAFSIIPSFLEIGELVRSYYKGRRTHGHCDAINLLFFFCKMMDEGKKILSTGKEVWRSMYETTDVVLQNAKRVRRCLRSGQGKRESDKEEKARP